MFASEPSVHTQLQILTTACDTLISGPTTAWEEVAQACQTLADLCREEKNRSSSDVSQALECVASLYSCPSPSDSFVIQGARLLGNACADHDENRAKVMDTGIVKDITRFLVHYPSDSLVTRNLTGALLNWSISNEAGREAIIAQDNLLSTLVAGLKGEGLNEQEGATNMFFLLSLLSNLADDPKFTDAFKEVHGAKPLVEVVRCALTDKVFSAVSVPIRNVSLSLLCHVSQQMDEAQDAIVHGGLIPLTLKFIQNPDNDLDDEEEEEESEEGTVTKGDGKGDPQPFKGPRASAVKILIHGLMSDNCMDDLFKDVSLRKSLLQLLKNQEDSILAMTAAHCIGNLARKEEHCVAFLEPQDGLPDPARLIIQRLEEATRVKDLRLEHALAGLIKNLSIPRQNKQILGEKGAIFALEPLMDRSILPLVMISVGTLKHLTQGNVENASLMVKSNGDDPSPLQHLLTVLEKNDDPGVKSEGGRLVVNLVRLLSTPHPKGDHDQAYGTLKSALEKSPSILDPCLWMVVWSKFAVLRNDGLLALILLAQHSDATRKWVAESIPRSIAERGLSKEDQDVATSSSEPAEGEKKNTKGIVWDSLVQILAGEGNGVEGGVRCNATVLLATILPEMRSLGLMQDGWSQRVSQIIASVVDEPFPPEGSKELLSLLVTLKGVLTEDGEGTGAED
ncbi:armadillo-type protein [Piptocephalis cylindrospora]|uniref:Armadillo-type protein n=1 Tax=Piptocephalis cylindrospora TaxID=1907219 RepID=A0A4P9Y6H1_9FUNG|nr:armadillo-type protein [Piptocephalis cylindrospora]|eukprot:RKP13440.1 armadillo-type protein [Piptocephalis cylindrospora]